MPCLNTTYFILVSLIVRESTASMSISVLLVYIYIGLVHPQMRCHGCLVEGIAGVLWKCVKCFEYFLCTPCYAAGKHCVEHPFSRIDGVDLTERFGEV